MEKDCGCPYGSCCCGPSDPSQKQKPQIVCYDHAFDEIYIRHGSIPKDVLKSFPNRFFELGEL